MSSLNFLKNMSRNTILVIVAIIAIVITGVLILANSNHGFSFPTIFGMSDSQIAKKAIDYINSNQLSQTPASLVSTSEESGLIKIKIKIGSNSFDSYVTRDGKFLFPQAVDISGKKANATANQNASNGNSQTAVQILASIQKTSKPSLEAFVVSSCPFGLQMQRMISDAVKNIPSLASNIVVRYIGSISNGVISSMHGPEEAQENLRQICIREEQPTKYWNYVSCYMKKTTSTASSGMPLGDSPACQASTGIDTVKLNACVSDTSRGLAYAQKDFDLSNKYNVSGSPTLVVNGATVEEFTSANQPVFGSSRSSDEIKTIICDSATSKPSFCSTNLNTAQASASFSATYATASGSGSAGGNTGCQTAQ